jgi:adenylate cyclase
MDQLPSAGGTGPRLRIGAFRLDPARACLVSPDGAEVALRPKTFEVLLHLARNPRRVVPRAELMDAVWPEVFVTDDSLTQCIGELRRALGAEGEALLRTVPRRGYVLEAETAAPARAPGPSPSPPTLAVLPFDNLSGDPRWDRLCDGLSEDMITDLARHPELRVIARTSSFAWRGRRTDIRRIGRALKARYLLEGSVQADAGRVGVTAQLIEAESGAHVWAARHDCAEAGLFEIQAEVVSRVAGAVAGLSGSIARTELRRLHRAPPASLAAYELYLAGYEQEARLDREGTLRGIALLEAAVAADPTLSRAWTVLGFALANAAANGWAEDVAALRARQEVAIRRAVALDPEDGLALEELGATLARRGDLDGARDAFGRAAQAGANHADTLALLGKYMVEVLGQPGAAERMTARAFDLNPAAPPWYLLGATRVAYFTGDFARAAECAARAPALRLPRLLGVLALAQMDRAAEARHALGAHRAAFGADPATALAALPPLCAEAAELLREGLARAGLGQATPVAPPSASFAASRSLANGRSIT